MTTIDHPITSELGQDFRGRVITAGTPEYDAARALFAGGFDRRPAAIVQPRDAEEVARVVRVARSTGLPLAVRSGGHSAAGLSVCDDGIVVDLRLMKELQVDPTTRTAWAGAGLTAGEYTTAAATHGMATGFGDTGSVGLGGITLGGGVGFLSRKFGLTVDQLLAAELVTADGDVLLVDRDHEPDLFWAIRGGGGNFGVVTRFEFRLRQLAEVYGGLLMLPATPDTVTSFLQLAADAPDELTTILNVMPAPPMPFVPVEVQGSLVAMALVCYAGPAVEGERVLAPFRALAAPVADTVGAVPYPAMFAPQDPDYHPTAVGRTLYVDALDRQAAALILDRLAASEAPMRVTQLRVLGGAVGRVSAEETAYAHRASRIMVNVAAFYETPDLKQTREAWVADLAAAIEQDNSGAYVNFLGDDAPARIRDAYPGTTWHRLVEVKRRYDPTNLFRLNANIPPDGV